MLPMSHKMSVQPTEVLSPFTIDLPSLQAQQEQQRFSNQD